VHLIIATDVQTSDVPNLQRVLADLGIAQSSVLPTPSVPSAPVAQPSTPSVSGADAAAPAREARQFYAAVKAHLGRSLTAADKATAKVMRKQGHDAGTVAGVLAAGQAPQAPAPVDPNAERIAALQAQLNALQSPQATPSVSSGSTLTSMPSTSAGLTEAQKSALRAWSSSFVSKPRIEGILAYVEGQFTWSQVEALGVKTRNAVRHIAAV